MFRDFAPGNVPASKTVLPNVSKEVPLGLLGTVFFPHNPPCVITVSVAVQMVQYK